MSVKAGRAVKKVKNLELVKQEMETELTVREYVCKEREKYQKERLKDRNEEKVKNPIRFTYSKGLFRILTESQECPWWTVQRMSGASVAWFVDFPFDVGVKTVFAFVDSVSSV